MSNRRETFLVAKPNPETAASHILHTWTLSWSDGHAPLYSWRCTCGHTAVGWKRNHEAAAEYGDHAAVRVPEWPPLSDSTNARMLTNRKG